MPYTTLITTEELTAHLHDPAWVIVDCRFDLAKTEWGHEQYLAGHIPGAVYAHLDEHLSGAKTGVNGRHPLPDAEALRQTLSAWGIGAGVQVAAYDQGDGMYASRLWWLLRSMGHEAAAVLNGGLARWQAQGYPLRGGDETRPPAQFSGAPRPEMLLTAQQVEQLSAQPGSLRLLDARAPVRYRGELEPIDPVAGHIPGAANYPYQRSLAPDGTFLAPDALRAELHAALDGAAPAQAGTYCGSGVAASHTLLALEHAGLPGARLYAGSWSEWSADPSRPIGKG